MRVLQITVFSILFMSTGAFINMLLLKNTNAAVVNASLGFFSKKFSTENVIEMLEKGVIHAVRHIIHKKITLFTPVFYGNHEYMFW